uniref:Nucleocapsid n=1 Tax=Avulavirus sp. TaxID=2493083 RepID=A0A481XU60_9MONO|nr:NP [Avulavirus sp.]QBK47283.1 NP [Avulavirus sp.]
MSSVFAEYDKFLENQTHPPSRALPTEGGGSLKVEVPVFVLNSDDPELRWRFVCFCLRLAISESSNRPLRQGALISVLCAHAQVMKTYATLAAQSGEAVITILEIDDFDDKMPVFNSRSGITDERAARLALIAADIPRACSNETPFANAATENEPPEDASDTLDRIFSVQVQVWITVAKAMTAFETAEESETRRLNKYMQQGRVQKKCLLYPIVRTTVQMTIRQSLVIRGFLVNEMKRAQNSPGGKSAYYSFVGDISAYIKNAGVTAFLLTLKFGIQTRLPALALSSLAGDIQKVKQLMVLYREKGENGPFMTLLGDPDQMQFAPAEYSLLYSYAMGVASVLEASTSRYQFARDFMNPTFWRIGVESAQSLSTSVDEQMATELQLGRQSRAALGEMMAKVAGSAGEYTMNAPAAAVMIGASGPNPPSSARQSGSGPKQTESDIQLPPGFNTPEDYLAYIRNEEAFKSGRATSSTDAPKTPGLAGDNDPQVDWEL